ncbi:hypothetical protein GCM10020000_24010 [Streptomyces olivoverticillatus]
MVGTPLVVKMSFRASGTPSQRAQLLAALALGVDGAGLREGALAVHVQERVDLLVDGVDPGQVGLGDLDGRDLAGGDLGRDLGGGELDQVCHVGHSSPRICGTLKRCCSWAGGAGERLLGGQRRTDLVRPHDVGQGQRMGGRGDVLVGHIGNAGDRADDHVELFGEVVELFGLQLQT